MPRLLIRLGFRPYPAPVARSGRCFALAESPAGSPLGRAHTLAMYQAASALLLVVAAARPVATEDADVRADD